jgi:iron complex outermembrane recepter protein
MTAKNLHTSLLRSTALVLTTSLLASTLASTSALAQQATQQEPTTQAGADETVFGDIIVTAQKRAQNLQEVPAAVSVVSSAQLEQATGFNIEGVTNLVPTLTFRKGGTNLNSSLFLRGVGTINFSIAAEPSVSTVVDGVVYARSGEAFGDLVDIERIEVLRGPQGTLFGKNASAGAINIVTKRPGKSFGAQAELTYAEGDEYKARASVDIPFSDSVRSRITAFYSFFDGNIDNLFLPATNAKPDKINGFNRKGIRGIIEADATDSLKLTFIADYRQSDDDCCAEVIGTASTAAGVAPAINSLLAGIRLRGDETREVRHNLTTRTEEESFGFSLQGDLSLGDFTLTSITAYREFDNREVREGDFLDRTAPFVGNGFAQLHDDGPQTSSTFTQELRIASPSGQRFEYVAGLFYYEADAVRVFRRDVTVCTASTLGLDATGQRPCLPGASTFVSAFSTATFGSEFKNFAAFGQGTFNITDRFKLIAGLRYTRDELAVVHNRIPSPIALPGIRTDTTGFNDETDNDNLSGKAGVQFQVTDDFMTYATYSRGYKGPAFNVFFNQTPQQRNPIEAETADAFEAGFKSTLLGGRVILNAAAFTTQYNNFQANNFDVLNGVIITRLTNAGDISTSGFELDFLARPLDNLTFSGGLAYTDAQIERFRDATGTISDARKGERLALAPELKITLGVDYKLETDALPFNVFFNTQGAYTSKQFSDLGENPLLVIDSFTTVNASIGFADKEDRFRLTFFVNNLFDESFASLITPGGPGGTLRFLIPREADQFFGATLRVKFAQ